MFMDETDRLVYFQVFQGMQNPKKKRENNPYKQGSVCFHAWNEGFDYYDYERKYGARSKGLTPVWEP